MTVQEFYEYCKSPLRVISAYNGKVLCKDYNPKKHTHISNREVSSVWAGIQTSPNIGYGGDMARAIICVYVNGYEEWLREHPEENNE